MTACALVAAVRFSPPAFACRSRARSASTALSFPWNHRCAGWCWSLARIFAFAIDLMTSYLTTVASFRSRAFRSGGWAERAAFTVPPLASLVCCFPVMSGQPVPSVAATIPDRKRCRIRSTVSSALMTLPVAAVWRSDLQSHIRCCKESSVGATQKGHIARCVTAGVVGVTSVARSVRPPIRSSRVAVRWEAPPLIAALASSAC
jgi:hypothetical protein